MALRFKKIISNDGDQYTYIGVLEMKLFLLFTADLYYICFDKTNICDLDPQQ